MRLIFALFALLVALPSCASPHDLEADCSDGADNDHDGLVDCRDSDCAASADCSFTDGGTCGPATCATCCTSDGRCAADGDLSSTCGSGGALCASCTGTEVCSIAGCIPTVQGCSLTLPSAGPAVDTCAGSDICLCPGGPDAACTGTGTCAPASGRSYRFELDYVLTDLTKPNAEAWDAAGGAPDPFAVLEVNGQPVGLPSTTLDDTFDAQWFPAPSWTVTLHVGDAVRLDAYDEDLTVHDWIGGCEIASLTAANLRQREFACSAVSADIRGYVQPL